LVTGKSDEARDEGYVCELLSWLAICTESRFVAVRAFLEVFMWSGVAAA
jgi:hypothetical protein